MLNSRKSLIGLSYFRTMKLYLLIATLFVTGFSFSQEKMMVFFKDKGDEGRTIELSDRSLRRRYKNNVVSDHNDVPVNANYIQQLSTHGEILNRSRWLNAVVLNTDESPEFLLSTYSFIKEIKAGGTNHTSKQPDKFEIPAYKAQDYGHPDTQNLMIGVQCLHDQGFEGQGIYLAVIDAGFLGMDTISYFDSLYLEGRILDTHDFLGPFGVYNYSGHGTAVSSCIVADKGNPDRYVGTATKVDLALYVTEDVDSETQMEEFYLVEALERCDSVGVEIANISLGYFGFDDSLTSYTYDDMDGSTTISAIGASIAASKGIIVVTSAGNNGPFGRIGTPCDADSILCAAATDGFENWAWFSSIGPSFDGRVKPDVATHGGGAWAVMDDGVPIPVNGTSFSSPVLAGAVACLVQANPMSTAQEIIQAVRESADQFNTPDSLKGYGIPDFCQALVSVPEIEIDGLKVFPNPANQELHILSGEYLIEEIQLIDPMGRVVQFIPVEGKFSQNISTETLLNGSYFLQVKTEATVWSKHVIIRHF